VLQHQPKLIVKTSALPNWSTPAACCPAARARCCTKMGIALPFLQCTLQCTNTCRAPGGCRRAGWPRREACCPEARGWSRLSAERCWARPPGDRWSRRRRCRRRRRRPAAHCRQSPPPAGAHPGDVSICTLIDGGSVGFSCLILDYAPHLLQTLLRFGGLCSRWTMQQRTRPTMPQIFCAPSLNLDGPAASAAAGALARRCRPPAPAPPRDRRCGSPLSRGRPPVAKRPR